MFRIVEPCIVNIRAWPLDNQSDPDLYMGIDTDNIDEDIHLFSSDAVGVKQITVFPDDSNFSCGLWRLVVHSCSKGPLQSVGLELIISEAESIIELVNGMEASTVSI